MEETNEVSAEAYKIQVMRTRFAEKVSEYEDLIASLVTRNAQLEQEVSNLRGKEDEDVVEEKREA